MNIKSSRILATLAAAVTLTFTPSCELVEVMAEDGSLFAFIDEVLAGTTTEDGEMYDQEGNPIYGYDGNYAVYGYNQSGAPIYNVSDLTNNCIVPVWAPRPTAAPRPVGVRMAHPPVHVHHKHGPALRKPGEKFHRRATREERRRMHEARRKHGRPDMRHDMHGRPDMRHDKHGRPDMRHDKHGRPDMRHGKHGRPDMRHDKHGRPDMRHDKHGRPDMRHDKHGRPDMRPDKHGRPDKRADKPSPSGKPDHNKGRH